MSKSRTGQKWRTTSVSVDAECSIDEFSTLDLIDELLDRAENTPPDKEARAWVRPQAVEPSAYEADKVRAGGASALFPDEAPEDLERALIRHDFAFIEEWLWRQIKARWPRPKMKPPTQSQQALVEGVKP